MTDNSYRILEFDKIVDILASNVKTYGAGSRLKSLAVSPNIDKLNSDIELSKQMTELYFYDATLQFEPVGDVSAILESSRIEGAVLEIEDMLQVRMLLELYRANRSTVEAYAEKYPLLANRFCAAEIPSGLVTALTRTFDTDGSVLDSASPELKSIRKRRTSLRAHIQDKLYGYMDRTGNEDAVQERLITVRDGRYVIPVKSSCKNRDRFVVHSFSKTGETFFAEPQEIVMYNNELAETDDLESAEIFRILRFLTAEIARESGTIDAIGELLGEMEFLYAKARFAKEYRCDYPKIVPGEAMLKLKQARHPLLVKKSEAVPIDVELGIDFQGLIISGPNAGGKTVALKTAGLLSLMALSGLPIPADRNSRIGTFSAVYAEIGDEQSIADELSTFSGHILRISEILKRCDADSLILIDELAGSTEPKEGEALGQAVIREMLDKGAKFIVTTHYQQLKEMPYSDKRLANAFVEFDEHTLSPHFTLHIGAPGMSYAIQIAKRFGLRDSVIADASAFLKAHTDEQAEYMETLNRERNALYKRKAAVERHMNELRTIKAEYVKRSKELEEKLRESEKKGVSKLRAELDDAILKISEVRENLRRQKAEALDASEDTVEAAKRLLDAADSEIAEREKTRPDKIEPGAAVYVRTYGKTGIVEDVSEGRVKVRIGILSATVDASEIYTADESKKPEKRFALSREMTTGYEFILDIRGERMEDAVKRLDKNVEIALMQGADEMYIIHGTGQGILRKAVWDYFKDKNFIASIGYARPEDGGQGKTIVKFK